MNFNKQIQNLIIDIVANSLLYNLFHLNISVYWNIIAKTPQNALIASTYV